MGKTIAVIDLSSEEGFKKFSDRLREQMLHGVEEPENADEAVGFGVCGGDSRVAVCPGRHIHIDFLSPSHKKETCFTLEVNGHWSVSFNDAICDGDEEPSETKEPTTH